MSGEPSRERTIAGTGVLRMAEGGTVFFDEIGDITPYAQTKILRAIETREIYPLGGKRKIPLEYSDHCRHQSGFGRFDGRKEV